MHSWIASQCSQEDFPQLCDSHQASSCLGIKNYHWYCTTWMKVPGVDQIMGAAAAVSVVNLMLKDLWKKDTLDVHVI